jgi:hypothetical protein
MGSISCCGSHVGIPKDNSRHIPTSLGSNGSVVSDMNNFKIFLPSCYSYLKFVIVLVAILDF